MRHRRAALQTCAGFLVGAAGLGLTATAAPAATPGTPPQGAPGSLVAGFGNTAPPLSPGLVLGPSGTRFSDVAVQADGRVLAAGQEGTGGGARLIVARYGPDGALDTSFGSGGIARGPSAWSGAEGGAAASYGAGVAVLPDGRIVVGGGLRDSAGAPRGLLAVRFTPSGALDTGFGGDGAASALTASAGRGTDAVVDGSGRVVVAGASTGSGSTPVPLATVARWRPDGTLDPGFGSGGVRQVGVATSSTLETVALQPDGRLMAAGFFTDVFGASAALAFRLTPEGLVDPSFASGGVYTRAFSRDAAASRFADVTVAPDGDIVLAGTAGNRGSGDAVVLRLTPGGSGRTGFGDDGLVQTAAAPALATVGRVPPPGAAGVIATRTKVYSGGPVDASGNFRLLALTALDGGSGSRVPSFGAPIGAEFQEGMPFADPFGTTYTFVHHASNSPYAGPMGQTEAIALTPDGTGVIAAGLIASRLGQNAEPGDQRGFVARYLALAEPPPPAPDPGPAPTPDPGPAPGPGPAPLDPAPNPDTSGGTPVTGSSGDPIAAARLTGLSLRPATLRPGTRTALRFTLSRAAGVRLRVQVLRTGRRAGAGTRCRLGIAPSAGTTRCTLPVSLSGSRVLAGRAGLNRVTLTRRIAGRTLRPGRYRLVLRTTGGSDRYVALVVRP